MEERRWDCIYERFGIACMLCMFFICDVHMQCRVDCWCRWLDVDDRPARVQLAEGGRHGNGKVRGLAEERRIAHLCGLTFLL
jgi:hypothetical protein